VAGRGREGGSRKERVGDREGQKGGVRYGVVAARGLGGEGGLGGLGGLKGMNPRVSLHQRGRGSRGGRGSGVVCDGRLLDCWGMRMVGVCMGIQE
jgi:hypothetical protein